MKKTLLLVTLLMVGLHAVAKNEATISFQTKSHDFGQLSEEQGSASVNFLFTNTGNSPLVIYKAVASCGCTTPVYSKEPIAAGASSSIKVTYNTTGRPGAFHKTITIYTNDPDAPNILLTIKGTVSPKAENAEVTYPKNMQGLRLQRTVVPILEAKIGSIKTETIEVINTNNTPIKLAFNKVPKHLVVTASNSTLLPNETGILTINYLAAYAKDYGKREDSFYIVTSTKDKTNPNNRINLSANITEDFSTLSADQLRKAPVAVFSEKRINFGKMARGSHKEMTILLSNQGENPLLIRKIIPEYDGIKVTPDKRIVPGNRSIKLKIAFNAGTFDGNVVQRITVITNDPKSSINRLYITAQVTAEA
jgi:hypothetical protein